MACLSQQVRPADRDSIFQHVYSEISGQTATTRGGEAGRDEADVASRLRRYESVRRAAQPLASPTAPRQAAAFPLLPFLTQPWSKSFLFNVSLLESGPNAYGITSPPPSWGRRPTGRAIVRCVPGVSPAAPGLTHLSRRVTH